jgi:hypothetical protein
VLPFSITISTDQKKIKKKIGVCILWIKYEEKEMRKDEKKKCEKGGVMRCCTMMSWVRGKTGVQVWGSVGSGALSGFFPSSCKTSGPITPASL